MQYKLQLEASEFSLGTIPDVVVFQNNDCS